MGEPVLVALLYADRVIVEEGNHKKSIIGSFTRFFADKIPTSFPPWYIYAAVTNLSGPHAFSINLVHDKEKQVVVPISGKFEVKRPGDVVDLIIP
ncbi:unnamed protein product, partial [marine sediment metagenome]